MTKLPALPGHAGDEQPKTPLKVMLATMEFWDNRVEDMRKQLEALVVNPDDPESARAAASILRDFINARQQAMAAAVAAAPYCHGRMETTDVSPVSKKPPLAVDLNRSNMTLHEVMRIYQRLVEGDESIASDDHRPEPAPSMREPPPPSSPPSASPPSSRPPRSPGRAASGYSPARANGREHPRSANTGSDDFFDSRQRRSAAPEPSGS